MDMRALSDNQGQWKPQAGADRRYIEFHTVAWHNKVKSQEAGRPVHEPAVFLKIQHPGEHDFVDRPATDADKNEFPRQWAAFEVGRQAIPEGTLLATLFPNHPEVVEMMRFQKVFTAEQLADLNDTQLQSLGMGGRKFQTEAKQFLAAAEKGKEFHELRAETERLRNDNAAKDARMAALEARLVALESDEDAPAKPKRGRPPNQPNL